jgi:hypothetical protein
MLIVQMVFLLLNSMQFFHGNDPNQTCRTTPGDQVNADNAGRLNPGVVKQGTGQKHRSLMVWGLRFIDMLWKFFG